MDYRKGRNFKLENNDDFITESPLSNDSFIINSPPELKSSKLKSYGQRHNRYIIQDESIEEPSKILKSF